MERPNIFKYATSELSQDAFLCWFIAWADRDQYRNDVFLHTTACCFVRELLGVEEDYEIKTIKVGRQWNNIDVWTLVNDKYFIVIEDKKGTSEHSNQLGRYEEIAKKEYEKSNIEVKLVYFKMEEQGSYKNIEKAGFSIFTREKMLSILTKCIEKEKITNVINHILNDYYESLLELDKKINSYKELPLDKWHWYSWQGFYSEIQSTLKTGTWKYVSNPSGGFLGFWWYSHYSEYKENNFEFYLQIEQDKLIFKLHSKNPEDRKEIRSYYRNKLYLVAKEMGINIKQYGRIGKTMSVAKLVENYRKTNSDGTINMKETIKTLQSVQSILDEVYKKLNN